MCARFVTLIHQHRRAAGLRVRARATVAVRLQTHPHPEELEPMIGETVCPVCATTLINPTTRMTERYAHAAPGHLLAAVQRISRTAVASATDTGTDTPAEQSA